MGAVIMDGSALAKQIRQEIKAQVSRMEKPPTLMVCRFPGFDEASDAYVKYKKQDCQECGISVIDARFYIEDGDKTSNIWKTVLYNNAYESEVDGIILQLPVPKSIDVAKIQKTIKPEKDVDGLNPINQGLLFQGNPLIAPCTPNGCMYLLRHYGIPVSGKRCVVVGRSNIVGKPMAAMLLNAGGTVTVCHSKTNPRTLAALTRRADILVSAVGKPGLITGDIIKPGAAVLDVGTTRGEDGKLHGDVVFEEAKEVAGYITPVPGGVGPMTRAMLLKNVVERHVSKGVW